MATAIVTGGAKGIGKAIVRELAENGHKVIINYNNSHNSAEKLKKGLSEKGYLVDTFKADVSKRNEVKKLIEYTNSKFGNIDILVNNAGISEFKLFSDITDDDWNRMLNINLNSVFYTSQEVVKSMLQRKNGCIINISSIWGITGASCEVHYSVSKAAIDGLTKALAKELAPSGIRVNSIAPGMIETEMNKNLTDDEIEEIKTQIPLGKIGNAKSIAKCVKWLVEDDYTTGQVISPNGGWVI